jgi:F-type H+-transporting ATPase subunit b
MIIHPVLAAALSEGSRASGLTAPIEQVAGQFGVSWPLLSAQIINFCLVAFLIYRFGLKPILSTLDTRKAKIAEGLEFAEAAKAKLAQAEQQYTASITNASIEAEKTIQRARDQAKDYMEKRMREAQVQAETIFKKGQLELEAEKEKTLAAAREEIGALVVQITAKVLSKELSTAEQSRFNETATQALSQQ